MRTVGRCSHLCWTRAASMSYSTAMELARILAAGQCQRHCPPHVPYSGPRPTPIIRTFTCKKALSNLPTVKNELIGALESFPARGHTYTADFLDWQCRLSVFDIMVHRLQIDCIGV
ncbi:uncharacterized protein LOC129598877 isoform X2 [Paramacrobiotus metropolitanus]|uniref:uncharacterized protein LOC129598877 isoform X2 n=1 Tax=Paramacrobiotus metropolitanus TaxID=2943436 RepID=UPI0024463CF8|nr:uncharacterized protein LOC129598877 isoform X2 [Paramacrobiotus metropolitanus]